MLLGKTTLGKLMESKLNWKVTILGKDGDESIFENIEINPCIVIILLVSIVTTGPLDWNTVRSIKFVEVIAPLNKTLKVNRKYFCAKSLNPAKDSITRIENRRRY